MTAEKFTPSFTTSASAADERRESRSDYFGSNVTTTEGSRRPSNVREVESRGMKPVPPKPPKMPLSKRQQKMMWPK